MYKIAQDQPRPRRILAVALGMTGHLAHTGVNAGTFTHARRAGGVVAACLLVRMSGWLSFGRETQSTAKLKA
jgi:hypothetical protein